jgi:hypothetical protein
MRTIKDTVGYSRNGYGMRCAKVIPENNVNQWATDALKKELENAGYTVTGENDTQNVVDGAVFDIFCDTYMTYEGRVNVKVSLKKKGETIFDKNYSATQSGGVNWAATEASFAKTLELTLQEAIKQAVYDIDKGIL